MHSAFFLKVMPQNMYNSEYILSPLHDISLSLVVCFATLTDNLLSFKQKETSFPCIPIFENF